MNKKCARRKAPPRNWTIPRLIPEFPFPVINRTGDVDFLNERLPFKAWKEEWKQAYGAIEDASWGWESEGFGEAGLLVYE